MEWDDLKVILAIGRAGTLSGAARSLGLNHSTVFRRINAIEKKLDVRFFERLQQGYRLTDAGELAMTAAEKVETQVSDLARELVGKDLRLQGGIRVTAPEGVSLRLLSQPIARFCELHPNIHIDLIATGSRLQLARREADLAVRVTSRPPDTTIGKRICQFRFGFYATKQYLEKHARGGMETYSWVMTEDSRDWFPAATWKKFGQPERQVVLTSNSTMAIVNAAREGLGVAPLPCFLGDGDKDLVRVIEPPEEMVLEMWLLTHPDLRYTARVKALMGYLYEQLVTQKDLIEGNLASDQSKSAALVSKQTVR